jgi:hypothetical protein
MDDLLGWGIYIRTKHSAGYRFVQITKMCCALLSLRCSFGVFSSVDEQKNSLLAE